MSRPKDVVDLGRINDRLNNLDSTREQLGGIGRTLVFDLIRTGQLRAVKIGRRTMIPQSQIDAYIARQLAGDAA